MTLLAPEDSVGSWAREKLECLRKYLSFYTTALKNQTWCRGTIYVDAFAGPGRSPVRSTGQQRIAEPSLWEVESDPATTEFLNGSPRVALDIPIPFTKYVFVERNAGRLRQLHTLIAEYGGRRDIAVRSRDANTEIKDLVLNSGIDWQSHRAVMFLDPFGMHVPWTTMETVARTRAIEVMINFPLGMAIQRLLARSGDISSGRQHALDEYFGDPGWRALVYQTQVDLLGPKTTKVVDSSVRLVKWYRGRLRDIFGHASSARLIRNTRGGHLYYLIWAGPHPLGLKGANYVLGQGEAVH
jgi:three-Cys-motif partner protein